MQLDEFISQTLNEIINGVKEAQKACTESNPIIVPYRSGQRPQQIEFDVALTVEKGTQTKGGIGVLSGIVNLGSAGQSDNSQTAVNRIKFTIPVYLPSPDRPKFR
jgi:hypothetical protein